MPTQATLVTLEDFRQMPPPPPGVKRELIEGVVTEMGKALGGHEKVKSNFIDLFAELCNRKTPWALVSESEFVLGETMDAIPDVAIVRRSDILAAPSDKHFSFPPVLAVEVVSSEKAEDLEAKVRGYLAHGVALGGLSKARRDSGPHHERLPPTDLGKPAGAGAAFA